MENLRRGRAPTITRGPYVGEKLTVDHIIPRAVAPTLDKVLANLELMPPSLNIRKGAKIGQRQVDLANKLQSRVFESSEHIQIRPGFISNQIPMITSTASRFCKLRSTEVRYSIVGLIATWALQVMLCCDRVR